LEQTKAETHKSERKWIFAYSIAVTVLHSAVPVSWFVFFNLTPDLGISDRIALFSGYWIVPELIGAKWFSVILLVLSFSVVIIAGRLAENEKSRFAIILLVLNLCCILMTGWGLL